ncbi:MAG: RNA polymerase sigma factor [Sandaracinaceae bacterium]
MHPSDAALAQAVRSGDPKAFRSIVDRHGVALHTAAWRLVGEHEADDVVQESLTKAYVALSEGRFASRGHGLGPWLKRIVARTAHDALRARTRRRGREVRMTRSTEETASTRLALRDLARSLAALPPSQSTALVLKELEGLSTAEIAAAMGCSVGAVEQRLVRARATLRRQRTQ